MNLFHKTWKYFPFYMMEHNGYNHQFKISLNIIRRFVLGFSIDISSWYFEIEIKFIVFHILIVCIFNKNKLQ